MASLNEKARQPWHTLAVRFAPDLHADESGKVTLLASMFMLGLVALAGLIGNAGHVSAEKLETQNAADSVAYSSSLWMARGMNAITATNHMLGEATAIAAVHEAFGGPELDFGVKKNTTENSALSKLINTGKTTAPIVTSPFGYTPPPIPGADRKVVRFVADAMTRSDQMTAFATIYDARMTLKRQMAVILPIKTFANAGFFVPPPWGYGTAAIAYGVHIAGTANIVLIGKEWFVLKALEAIAKLFKPMKTIIESQLIPTLAAHADFVAGYDASTQQTKTGIVNGAIERVVLDLEERLEVEAALFPKFKELRLPVEPEPKPDLRGSSNPTRGWGTDTPPVISLPDIDLGGMKKKLDDAMDDMQGRIDQLNDDLNDLDDFEKDVDDRLKDDDISAAEKQTLEREKAAIQQSRRAKQTRLADIEENLEKLKTKRAEMESALDQPLPTRSANPSVGSIPRRMNQGQERYTQWVRAAYPQTDGFRAPIRAWLQQWAPKSKAAEYFDKWSNRYTLVKAWQFRSGYRPNKSGNAIKWNGSKKKALRMFVMKDAFKNKRDQKGRENWTGTSNRAKQQAEKHFTLIGVVHRDYEPLFSETLYPAPSDNGMTAYAQAIFYNASQQRSGSGRDAVQAKLGWDTLNWDPSIAVPEWGAPAYESAAKWPWEAFDGSTNQAVARVKLNWQAKLMPVRTSRLKEAAVTLEGDSRKNVEHAAKYFDKLGTH